MKELVGGEGAELLGVSSSYDLLLQSLGTSPPWWLQWDPSLQKLSLEPKPEKDIALQAVAYPLPLCPGMEWLPTWPPPSKGAFPHVMALSTIQRDPIYSTHLLVYYPSLPRRENSMMIETLWVSRCLAQCLGCSLRAEWVNEWKDRQDGTVGCVCGGRGGLLGGGVDKALYQARLPK